MKVLDRIQADLQTEAHAGRKACLQARKASLLVRWGDEAAGRELVQGLRQSFLGHEFSQLSAALCLVEGQLLDRDGMQAPAKDRFERAYGLSRAPSSSEIRGLAGACLAHYQAQLEQWDRCTTTLREVLMAAEPGHHEVLARCALTLANMFLAAGWGALASVWFSRARAQAAREGDGVTLGHLLHDTAVGQLERLRWAAMLDRQFTPSAADLESSRQLIEGALNYLSLTRSPALRALRPRLALAQSTWQVMSGQYAQAWAGLKALPAEPGGSSGRSLAQWHADRWWCIAHCVTSDSRGLLAQATDLPHVAHRPPGLDALWLEAWPPLQRWKTWEVVLEAGAISGYDEAWSSPETNPLRALRSEVRSEGSQSWQRLRAALNANRLEPQRWEMGDET